MADNKVVEENIDIYGGVYEGKDLVREGGQPKDKRKVPTQGHFNKEKIEKAKERRRNIVKEADRDELKKEEKEIDSGDDLII